MAPLRVGFISTTDPREPGGQSGMPHHAARALSLRGCDVEYLTPPPPGTHFRGAWRVRAMLRRFEFLTPGLVRRSTLAPALEANRWIERQVQSASFDALFDVCASPFAFDLNVETPLVYFSDLTTRLLRQTYGPIRKRSRAYQEMRERFERGILARAAFAAFPSDWARRSAIQDYGFPEGAASTIPLGANVTPDDPAEGLESIDPPRRRSLRLCIIAAFPERKRLDLAIEATERLVDRGWNARLDYIGPPTARATGSRSVRCLGRLRLGIPRDRERHCRALRECHLLILPSEGEAFGIAPCEAAHFARPSIVSSAGGLPTAVLHDETGIVMPYDADALAYADAIERLAQDEARYVRLCRNAHARAQSTLNWPRWGESIEGLLRSAAERTPTPVEAAIAV